MMKDDFRDWIHSVIFTTRVCVHVLKFFLSHCRKNKPPNASAPARFVPRAKMA